jgi:hypothetical protein
MCSASSRLEPRLARFPFSCSASAAGCLIDTMEELAPCADRGLSSRFATERQSHQRLSSRTRQETSHVFHDVFNSHLLGWTRCPQGFSDCRHLPGPRSRAHACRSSTQRPQTDPALLPAALQARGPRTVRVCYEASGAGYVLQRALEEWGIPCDLAAPSLIPRRSGA